MTAKDFIFKQLKWPNCSIINMFIHQSFLVWGQICSSEGVTNMEFGKRKSSSFTNKNKCFVLSIFTFSFASTFVIFTLNWNLNDVFFIVRPDTTKFVAPKIQEKQSQNCQEVRKLGFLKIHKAASRYARSPWKVKWVPAFPDVLNVNASERILSRRKESFLFKSQTKWPTCLWITLNMLSYQVMFIIFLILAQCRTSCSSTVWRMSWTWSCRRKTTSL